MFIKRLTALILISIFLFSSTADAQGFLKRLGFKKDLGLSNETISSGLREALAVGIDRTVKSTGKSDGYFMNKDIKIPLPKTLKRFERPLRSAGFGPQMDEFILSMNRAAEAAAPLAKDIFISAITKMTMKDAKGILNGKDTAATEYLDKNTRDQLREAFSPKITETMNQFEVTKKYQAVMEKYSSLPLARNYLKGNVEEYTTDRALDGLFFVLAKEEKRIRTKPAARTTELLRKVFK